jgi:asparagine synthase (glutamine-hydrolysing)
LAANASGIEYRWPLLDIRLIQFFLTVPAEYKLKNGLPRYLHRKAVQGSVPESLIWKDKDMGGAIKPVGEQFESIINSDYFAVDRIIFEKLSKELQQVIDEEKWQKNIQRMIKINQKEDVSIEVYSLITSLAPALILNEWINDLKRREYL